MVENESSRRRCFLSENSSSIGLHSRNRKELWMLLTKCRSQFEVHTFVHLYSRKAICVLIFAYFRFTFCCRAHYIIDTKGILRHTTINDIQVTRDVAEILKLVEAFQKIDDNEKDVVENEEKSS